MFVYRRSLDVGNRLQISAYLKVLGVRLLTNAACSRCIVNSRHCPNSDPDSGSQRFYLVDVLDWNARILCKIHTKLIFFPIVQVFLAASASLLAFAQIIVFHHIFRQGLLRSNMGDADEVLSPCPFGRTMRDTHFLFAPTYNPLNHGSFGTYPKSVQKRLHEAQALSEARPDTFVRYQYPTMLDESRAALADYLGIPVDEVVFVSNATTAINVVLRNLRYEKGDVILHLSTVYGAVEKTIQYLIEMTEVKNVNVEVKYPVDDHVLISQFESAIRVAKSEGLNVKIAVFDTISSMPGVRVPWERLVDVCKAEGVLSMVDGAHGAGHLDLNLARVQPDFFTSNCHK